MFLEDLQTLIKAMQPDVSVMINAHSLILRKLEEKKNRKVKIVFSFIALVNDIHILDSYNSKFQTFISHHNANSPLT